MQVWLKTRTSDGHVTVHRNPPRPVSKCDKMNSFINRDGDRVTEVIDSLGSVKSAWVEVYLED
jgi:hypothetical protein